MLPFYLGSVDKKKSCPSISPSKSYQISPPPTVTCVDQAITISPVDCICLSIQPDFFEMAILFNYNKSTESVPTYGLSFFTAHRMYLNIPAL